jgi:hypothetical protein
MNLSPSSARFYTNRWDLTAACAYADSVMAPMAPLNTYFTRPPG